jgi:hypothetical protein
MRLKNDWIDPWSGLLAGFLFFCAMGSLSLLKFGLLDAIATMLLFLALAVVTFRNGLAAGRCRREKYEAEKTSRSNGTVS